MRLAEVAFPSFVLVSAGLAAMSLRSEPAECKHAFVPPTLPTVIRVDAPAPAPAKRVESSDFAFVFKVGTQTFVKLGSADGIEHGRAKHVQADGIDNAIAPVTANHPWLGRDVIVDGTCKAKVTELAIVARLTGWDEEKYTAKQIMTDGVPVLAGKLDGCDGKYARPAELPAIVVPTVIDDPVLGDKAKELVLASRAADETSDEWFRDYNQSNWQDEAGWDIRVLKHPLTGTTWVSVHAWNEPACGSPQVNIWGLFRVREDGTLVARQLRKLGDMIRIDQLIDIEGDGELEVLGRPWLSDQLLTHESGATIDEMVLPYMGCAC